MRIQFDNFVDWWLECSVIPDMFHQRPYLFLAKPLPAGAKTLALTSPMLSIYHINNPPFPPHQPDSQPSSEPP